MADHYETLGVARDATDEELKRGYRKMARQYHPDANPDDPDAEARFKEVSAAYEVLSDPERRSLYDRFGTDDPNAAGWPIRSAGAGKHLRCVLRWGLAVRGLRLGAAPPRPAPR